MTNQRSTQILIGLFFAALLGLWGLERAGVLTEAERDRRRDRVLPDLVDLDVGTVRKVEIDRGPDRLVFERRGPKSWRITAPIDAEASSAEVDRLIATLKSLRKSPEAGDVGGDSARFGLAPPAATIRLWTGQEASPAATLEVGRDVQEERFVRAGVGGPIVVTSKLALAIGERPVAEWREAALAPPSADPVVGVSIRRKRLEATVERGGRGGWRLTSPVRFPADGAFVEKILADVAGMRIDPKTGFVADDVRDLERFGLNPPAATIEVRFAGGRPPLVVMLGSSPADRPDRVYATRQGEDDVVEIGAETLADLPPTLKPLRSQLIADFAPAAARRIEVETSQSSFRLERDRLGWMLKSAGDARADRQQVDSLLRALAELKTADFLDPIVIADSGVDPPRIRIRVWPEGAAGAADAEPEFDLALGRRDALSRTLFARLKGDDAILTLPDKFAESLPATKFAFRELDLPAIQPSSVSRLTIVRPGRMTMVVPAEDAGSPNRWRLTQPIEAAADVRNVTAALARLAQLRAAKFVAEAKGDLSPFGLDHPILEIRWQTREPGKPASDEQGLKIGSPSKDDPSKHYGVLDGFPAVFTIETGELMPFAAEFHDSRVMSFPPQTVRRLVLKSETRTLAYARRRQPLGTTSDWSPEPGTPAQGVDLSVFEDLVKALSDLRTTRFVQYEGPIPAPTELASPRLAVTVDFGGAKPAETLRIGAKFLGGWVCAATGSGPDGPVFLIEGPSWESLLLGVEGGLPPIPPDLFAPTPP